MIQLYGNDGSELVQLKDDGVKPDKREADGIYSVVLPQSPSSFIDQITERVSFVNNQGHIIKYTGHSGEMLTNERLPRFDFRGFNMFQKVSLHSSLLDVLTACQDGTDIAKEKSLLITELKVVEDPARTYNVVTGTGAPQGAWTFGQMMKNIAGGFADEANPTPAEITKVRECIKSWIKSIGSLNNSSTLTNATYAHIVGPWIKKANIFKNYHITNASGAWEAQWDSFITKDDINALLANAPFKLTAIVNRLDLRENMGYSNSPVSNAGETRFIFSLVQTLDHQPFKASFNSSMNISSNKGKPPYQEDNNWNNDVFQAEDWRGLNVILEYKNPFANRCAIKDFAIDWKNLSSYTWDPTDVQNGLQKYLEELQSITDQVTARNVMPNRTNGSAISQVRTNDRLLGDFVLNFWGHHKWKLRQFELNNNGYLVKTKLTNMPLQYDQHPHAIAQGYSKNYVNFPRNSVIKPSEEGFLGTFSEDHSSKVIVDWIYGLNGNTSHLTSVKFGNHSLPSHLLPLEGEMKQELGTYYGINYWAHDFPNNIYDNDNYNGASSLSTKRVRRQLSLNSCIGCHGAETKTTFTMIKPRGYGEPAIYWGPTPSVVDGPGHTDTREEGGNQFGVIVNTHRGETHDPDHFTAVQNSVETVPTYPADFYSSNKKIPVVAPFLTGRNYRGSNYPLERRYDDDKEFYYQNDKENSEDENGNLLPISIDDKSTNGLFYVNDPSNEYNTEENFHTNYVHYRDNPIWGGSDQRIFPQYHYDRPGFNDLDRRMKHLCRLAICTQCSFSTLSASDPCSPISVLQVAEAIKHVPLPQSGH
ncbi:MAG: hypothetical protein N4A45_06215 [Flavobacteriales bacterium]|jgi:hypothetical protein|nr:hypothetical protein [Flavobacteriales bacterium]